MSSIPRAAPVHGVEDAAGFRADDYWNALIDEEQAGSFLGLSARTMQKFRQEGGGPPYIVVSARCIRYRRKDMRRWADARVRTSTSDAGEAEDAA